MTFRNIENNNGKASALRGRILEAASTHFFKNGYEKTTLDNIVKDARISKSSIYKLYGGKKELFLAVLEQMDRDVQRTLPKFSEEPGKDQYRCLATTLKSLAINYLNYILDKKNLASFRVTLSASERHEEIASKYIENHRSLMTGMISKILVEANKKNIIKIETPAMSAMQFLGMVRGDLHLRALFDKTYSPSFDDIEKYATIATLVFLNGICPR